MTANQWRARIKQQTVDVGTYKTAFNPVIDALAKILEQRDAALKQFVAEGSQLIVTKISDRGAVNQTKNPLIVLWNELNSSALNYWRDLGLTPKGLNAIDDKAMQQKKKSALAEVLSGID